MVYVFPLALTTYFKPFETDPALYLNERVFYSNLAMFVKRHNLEANPVCQAELMAFQFLENGTGKPSVWGTYYQPEIYQVDGNAICQSPDIELINQDIINYWAKRAQDTRHPILKARYSGVVCDFYTNIFGQRAPFEIRKICTESLIAIYRNNLTCSAIANKFRIDRALNFAVTDNQKALKTQIKDLIMLNDNAIPVGETKNIWSSSYDLLVNRKPALVDYDEEQTIISLLEARLNELTPLDPWAAKAAAERLAGYYQKNGILNEVSRVLHKLGEAFNRYVANIPAIQVAGLLQELMLIYRYFHLNEEADLLMVRIRQVSKKADEEFKKVSVSGEFNTKELEAYANKILKFDGDVMFARIIKAQIIEIKELKDDFDQSVQSHPIRYYVSNSIVDKHGRVIAKIKPISETKDDHLVNHYYRTLQMGGAIYLHFIFSVGIRDNKLTTETVMDFLKKSCIIDEERYELINTGVRAFFDRNYFVCIHILIPQFEEALRNLLEANGGNILTYSDDTYPVKTFGHVLGDPIIAKAFGDDLVYYFKMLFVDSKGWNLRNQVAHGLLESELFNEQTAQRLMHAFFCLGMIRWIEAQSNS
ncbi:DUF4209 domain-containing protein [Sphingobacterium sp. UDSM-2020]|uniref:DUF4209 domain-containing protein n=1 Tax=Sphingobacterium sp. UDSM-2020 TaxID=2795738 RepID=UPI00193739EC|nr:DUF4209 domain-containing protein [Sphingobacterium sp. UDSM-2020]QQD14360.1 DUF4209 domain-containing protein [Sphingobacterium sp. UDSM-2020]